MKSVSSLFILARARSDAVINKISNLKFQIGYSIVAFLIFYFIKPRHFDVFEGIINTVIILAFNIFMKAAISSLSPEIISSFYGVKVRRTKPLIIVMKLMSSVMVGLSVVTVSMTIIAVIGVVFSDGTVNNAHMFALTLPVWLTVRSEILGLMDEFNQ